MEENLKVNLRMEKGDGEQCRDEPRPEDSVKLAKEYAAEGKFDGHRLQST